MAKRRSQKSRAGRDLATIARPLGLPRLSPLLSNPLTDLRLWHPAPATRPALTTFGRPARLALARPKTTQTRARLTFHSPAIVDPCAKRRTRRQVIFASGQGGKFHRPKRRTRWSGVTCKR